MSGEGEAIRGRNTEPQWGFVFSNPFPLPDLSPLIEELPQKPPGAPLSPLSPKSPPPAGWWELFAAGWRLLKGVTAFGAASNLALTPWREIEARSRPGYGIPVLRDDRDPDEREMRELEYQLWLQSQSRRGSIWGMMPLLPGEEDLQKIAHSTDPDPRWQYFFGAGSDNFFDLGSRGTHTCTPLDQENPRRAYYDPYGQYVRHVVAPLEAEGALAAQAPLYSLAVLSSRSDFTAAREPFNSLPIGTLGAPLAGPRPLVVSRRLGELRRGAIPLQFVVPSSDTLTDYFTAAQARKLNRCSVVVSAIKGLTEMGETPREYIARTLKAGRQLQVPHVGVWGYMASKVWSGMKRWEILLAVDDSKWGRQRADELARRWAGPQAVSVPDMEGQVSVDRFTARYPDGREVSIRVLSDPATVRANELASIYKNLMAIWLGHRLFNLMIEEARKRPRVAQEQRIRTLMFGYQRLMNEAKEAIIAAIRADLGSTAPAHILSEVEIDMKESWSLNGRSEGEKKASMGELFTLVQNAFVPHRATARRTMPGRRADFSQDQVKPYYSVRNPLYGFLLAAQDVLRRSDLTIGIAAEGVQVARVLSQRHGYAAFPRQFKEAEAWIKSHELQRMAD